MADLESNVFWVRIKGILHDCPDCGNPVPLVEIAGTLDCPSCGSAFEPDEMLWRNLFMLALDPGWLVKCGTSDDPSSLGSSHEVKSTRYRIKFDRSCEGSRCTSCGAAVEPPADVRDDAAFLVRCPSCGNEDRYEPATGWLKEKVPAVRHAGCAVAEQASVDPVAMACPNCQASLEIGAESARMTRCAYCGTTVRLPDDVWKTVHPTRKAADMMLRAVLGPAEFKKIGGGALFLLVFGLGWTAVCIPFLIGASAMVSSGQGLGTIVGGIVVGLVGLIIFTLPGLYMSHASIASMFRSRRLASRFS